MANASPHTHPHQRPVNTILLVLAGLLLAMMIARLFIGQAAIGWPAGSPVQAILDLLFFDWLHPERLRHGAMHIRMLRLIEACLVGGALAAAGVSLQTLLRNPLAEPFILGLSTGAGVGLIAQSLTAHAIEVPLGPPYLGALLGVAVTMAIVYTASRKRGVIDPLGMLLTGVVLSTIGGAIIMAMNYLLAGGDTNTNLGRWMMGFLNENIVGQPTLLIMLLVVVLAFAVLLRHARAMDAATFSDTEAISIGVNLPRLRTMLFVISSVLAAAAVTLGGPIAFVGLICPHIARLLLGPGHRAVLIASAMLGAMLILLADGSVFLIDAYVHRVGRMPIGIFTALIGGPMFLWMLRPHLGRSAG